MSKMIRLGAAENLSAFDAAVTKLIEDATANLPAGTVFEVRYGRSEDGKQNDLQWLSTPQLQTQELWARRYFGGVFDAVMQADGKTVMPRVYRVARLRTAAVLSALVLEDSPA